MATAPCVLCGNPEARAADWSMHWARAFYGITIQDFTGQCICHPCNWGLRAIFYAQTQIYTRFGRFMR